MEWIVKIQDEKNQRIRIRFNPLVEIIHFYGEYRTHNKIWEVFSEEIHPMKIELSELQTKMEIILIDMRKRLKEYNNIAEGFSVLKEIEFKED